MSGEVESVSFKGEDVVSSVTADIIEDPDDDDTIIENDEEDASTPIIQGVSAGSRYQVLSVEETYRDYYTKQRKTLPLMTIYEKAKILGIRAEMIARGAEPMISVPANVDRAFDIAKMELEQKKIPLLVRRYNPDGSYEDWRVADMVVN
jgi:DNA-directed RNA polymerases I, II, and III subunit RPABC2